MWWYLLDRIYTYNFEEGKIQKMMIKVWKCIWIYNFSLCRAHKILRRCFLDWIFTNPQHPLTIALIFELVMKAALVQKGQGGHPEEINNSTFNTITIMNLSNRCVLLSSLMSWRCSRHGKGFIGLFPFFPNLNWNEDVIIIINSGRKCMERSSAEQFYSSENQKSACALPDAWKFFSLSSA